MLNWHNDLSQFRQITLRIEGFTTFICPYGSDLEAPLIERALPFCGGPLIRSLSGNPSRRALRGKEADDGPGRRFFAEVELGVRRHLGVLAIDQAPVPEPPTLGGFRHCLAPALDEFAAIMLVTAPSRIPVVGIGRPTEHAC